MWNDLEAAAVQAIRSGRERIDLASFRDDLVLQTLVSISDRRSRRASG
jgi:hypothetical protein